MRLNIINKINMNPKGIIFSIDAPISFVIILFGILLSLFVLNEDFQENISQIRAFELEEKTLMLADTMVKNYDENNTLFGACVFDFEKKRALTNELSSENIAKARETSFGKIFSKSISYSLDGQKTTIILSNKKASECLSSKRFVLIDGVKGLIELITCRED